MTRNEANSLLWRVVSQVFYISFTKKFCNSWLFFTCLIFQFLYLLLKHFALVYKIGCRYLQFVKYRQTFRHPIYSLKHFQTSFFYPEIKITFSWKGCLLSSRILEIVFLKIIFHYNLVVVWLDILNPIFLF